MENKNTATAATVEEAIYKKTDTVTKEEYMSEEFFEYLYGQLKNQSSAFGDVVLPEVDRKIKENLKVTNFKRQFNNFSKNRRKAEAEKKRAEEEKTETKTKFTGQDLELVCTGYTCNDKGIVRTDTPIRQEVSFAPVMPVSVIRNLETGRESVVVKYRRADGTWVSLRCSKLDLVSAQNLIKLAEYGFPVDSTVANQQARYFSYLLHKNQTIIPEREGIGRLGFYGDSDDQFFPYTAGDNVVCDLGGREGEIIKAVHTQGSAKEWFDCVKPLRSRSIETRIMLAAALCSPMVKIVGTNSFVSHIVAGTGSGKTVILKAAASIFANPTTSEISEKYIIPFSSTANSLEALCSTIRSLPACIDELQSKSAGAQTAEKLDELIYRLTNTGKERSSRTGEMQNSKGAWRLTILSTGEKELTSESSGGGSVSRVINIVVPNDKPLIPRGKGSDICRILDNNFGFGKGWVLWLLDHQQEVINKYNEIYDRIAPKDKDGAISKQYDAVALILTADQLAKDVFWKDADDSDLIPEEALLSKIKKTANTNQHELTLQWLANKISEHDRMFVKRPDNAKSWDDDPRQDYIGVITDSEVSIMRNTLKKWYTSEYANSSMNQFLTFCEENGILFGDPVKKVKVKDRKIRNSDGHFTSCYVFDRYNLLNTIEARPGTLPH